jgi:hypothetical protein
MSAATTNTEPARTEYRIKTEARVNFAPDMSAMEVAAGKIENGAIVTNVEMECFEDLAPEAGHTYITTVATITVDRPTLPERVEEILENETAIRTATII